MDKLGRDRFPSLLTQYTPENLKAIKRWLFLEKGFSYSSFISSCLDQNYLPWIYSRNITTAKPISKHFNWESIFEPFTSLPLATRIFIVVTGLTMMLITIITLHYLAKRMTRGNQNPQTTTRYKSDKFDRTWSNLNKNSAN